MVKYEIYSGGTFKKTNDVLKVKNPYSGEDFAETFNAGKKELDFAIKKALEIQWKLKDLPSFKRFEILSFISSEITKNKKHLASVLAMESGKPMRYSLIEIERAAQTFLVAAEESKRLPSEYLRLDWTPNGLKKEGIVKYFPIGLVAGISPFNFPMNLAVHKIAPAIASGCPIILKPASGTPLSTLELAKIIDQTDLPKGAVSIMPMTRETGQLMVEDPRIKMLSFTGSVPVGWKMKKDAGKKKVLLELGGNAAVIITASANLEDAIKKSLVSGFAYSGQICIHAQRFFVEKSVYNGFVKAMVAGAQKLKFGDPLDLSTEISVMVDEDSAKRIEKWVSEAVKKGAKVLCGGKRKGIYYEPTVLSGTNPEMKVWSEELFGPVIMIEPYVDFKEAVKMVNDSIFGLQSSVFTNSISELDYAFNNIETGGVLHNDVPTFRADHMPYGGIKDSGLGREGLKYSIAEMMEPRILIRQLQ